MRGPVLVVSGYEGLQARLANHGGSSPVPGHRSNDSSTLGDRKADTGCFSSEPCWLKMKEASTTKGLCVTPKKEKAHL